MPYIWGTLPQPNNPHVESAHTPMSAHLTPLHQLSHINCTHPHPTEASLSNPGVHPSSPSCGCLTIRAPPIRSKSAFAPARLPVHYSASTCWRKHSNPFHSFNPSQENKVIREGPFLSIPPHLHPAMDLISSGQPGYLPAGAASAQDSSSNTAAAAGGATSGPPPSQTPGHPSFRRCVPPRKPSRDDHRADW
jgi:hypothetical protein